MYQTDRIVPTRRENTKDKKYFETINTFLQREIDKSE